MPVDKEMYKHDNSSRTVVGSNPVGTILAKKSPFKTCCMGIVNKQLTGRSQKELLVYELIFKNVKVIIPTIFHKGKCLNALLKDSASSRTCSWALCVFFSCFLKQKIFKTYVQ